MQPVESAQKKFTGTISLHLTDLIQMVCLSRSDLIIDIHSQKGKGSIHIRQGRIHHAQTEESTGEEAFFEVLRWNDGKFEILPFVDNGMDSVDKPWEHLLLEAVRSRDEVRTKGDDESGASALGEPLEEPSVGDLFDEIDDVFGKLVQDRPVPVGESEKPAVVEAVQPPVSVLVVDDSSFFSKKLKQMLEADPAIRVAGIAKNGRESLEFLKSNPRVDLITLDIEMPVMPGDTALKHIMIAHRIPVVIVSSMQPHAMEKIFDFLQLGAVDFFGKPQATENLDYYAAKLRALVKGASKAKVVNFKRLRKQGEYNRQPAPGNRPAERKILVVAGAEGAHTDWFRLPFHNWCRDRLVIGLQKLPGGFVPDFVRLLGKTTGLRAEPLPRAGDPFPRPPVPGECALPRRFQAFNGQSIPGPGDERIGYAGLGGRDGPVAGPPGGTGGGIPLRRVPIGSGPPARRSRIEAARPQGETGPVFAPFHPVQPVDRRHTTLRRSLSRPGFLLQPGLPSGGAISDDSSIQKGYLDPRQDPRRG